MKKLIVVSVGSSTGHKVAEQLRDLIGEKVIVEVVLMSRVSEANLKCDLALFTSDFIAKMTYGYFEGKPPYLIANRVINHKNIEKVISLPAGTEVLLVNDGESTAFQAIKQLIEIGLDHVKYYPYYPGYHEYLELEIAITPGEAALAPPWVGELIDIGTRILDIRTIYEIVDILEIDEVLKGSLVTEYIRDIVEISRAIDVNRQSARESEKLLETILNSVESGIAYVDNKERIISVNSKFASMFGKKKKDLLMKKISNIIEFIDIYNRGNRSSITKIEGREVLIDIEEIIFQEKSGYLITINYTDKISKLDHKIRRNYEKRITRKFYSFEDYLTVNKRVKDILKKAEKFSKTDGTILIQGENGTGKEVIAQAVHRNSYRRKNAFVPVNITAIASSLLESELFGYEEGAFTGAKKGGKAGLFEIANGGTIFIDELGDVPLDFQVKLLRVLEEKRIRRVGAIEEIPVDVRVIAATNKNLIKLIDRGEFREDLFFRLNRLPLKTIPLRHRKEDIGYLLMHFIKIYFNKINIKSLDELFEKETKEFLEKYRWRGNVRELINLVEYLSLIYEDEKIDFSSLPPYMIEDKFREKRILLDSNELWVLEQIGKNSGIGRTTLFRLSEKEDVGLGEGKIRGIIKRLKKKELVKQSNGTRGLIVSDIGFKILEDYTNG